MLVGGRTFHSFFGLGILEGGADAAVARALKSKKLTHRLRRAHCVVIDEVSMLSGTLLQAAEAVSRLARGRDELWGGLRIIVVGDFAQLPPITNGMQAKDWAFLHPVWRESQFRPALLSTVMRTQDAEFLRILNFVRQGTLHPDVRTFLDERTGTSLDHDEGTRLYPLRSQADSYNLRRLEMIPHPATSFPTEYIGDERSMDSAKRSMPIPDTLVLKPGALIMMRKNDPSPDRIFVNGSLGTVRRIDSDELTIGLLNGEEILIGKEKFSYLNGDGKEVVAAWNFPATLAWATTIHKAQGASLDRLIVDLERLWEPGQAYVALSRVRSGKGLSIEKWSAGSIRAEPVVTSFYNALSESTYEPRPLFEAPERESHRTEESWDDTPKKPKATRAARAKLIQAMLARQAPLADIAAECGIKTDRVFTYMEKLIEDGQTLDLSYLVVDIEHLSRIRNAFEESGTGPLKPVFEQFDGAVSYDTLKLVRCVMMAGG